jgi:hypothetical protein
MPSVLTIPSSNVYTIRGIDNKSFFTFELNGTKTTLRDIDTDIPKNLMTTLQTLAKEMKVPGVSKLKKADLVKIVSEHIRFV